MSDKLEQPLPKPVAGAARAPRPFAYRALCKVAGLLAVLSALPALAVSIFGLIVLSTKPAAPAWTFVGMGLIGVAAFGMIGLGSQIMKGRVWAAAIVALLDGCFTAWNLSNERMIPAAISSLIAALCLAVVVAGWRLHRVDRTIDGGGKTQ